MKKNLLYLIAFVFIASSSFAKGDNDSLFNEQTKQLKLIDSVSNAMNWQNGTVALPKGFANLNLPKDFKFLNAEQSEYILNKIWGNPPRTDIIGMIFPANGGPFADSSYAFMITYEETGYVKDEDADKIDYDEMMKNIQKQEPEENEKRVKEGYAAIHFIGWAQKPYYDKTNKVLHWAKEMQFGSDSVNTLNYEVRVLGRKGVLSMTAISTMNELPLVKSKIDDVLKIPEFTAGNKYSEFNESTDKVAEYTIGALVLGGVLAKTGAFALIGKFFLVAWKFILIGLAAIFKPVKNFFANRRNKNDNSEEVV
jgi:uncharacterized membrane-anchored protein